MNGNSNVKDHGVFPVGRNIKLNKFLEKNIILN